MMIDSRLLATVGYVLINSNGSHLKSVRMQFGQNGNYVYYDTILLDQMAIRI